ncbi:hypothetical protein C2E23DRAFT_197733 [Lenzites betulinus]|nr:hypothetical protein C2E23DRAFT_197733 [Lenzites betulinus]
MCFRRAAASFVSLTTFSGKVRTHECRPAVVKTGTQSGDSFPQEGPVSCVHSMGSYRSAGEILRQRQQKMQTLNGVDSDVWLAATARSAPGRLLALYRRQSSPDCVLASGLVPPKLYCAGESWWAARRGARPPRRSVSSTMAEGLRFCAYLCY